MALDTYGGLKDSVATWLARVADPQITTNAADFIAMAEGYMNRTLRTRQMETVLTFTTTDGSRNLPDDYLAWRRMTVLGDLFSEVEYMLPDVFRRRHPSDEGGIPNDFTIEGGNVILRPFDDDTSLEFLYYAKVSSLVDDADTNWVLTEHPDLYLAAALAEANAFLINPDHAALWSQKRDAIIDQVNALSLKTMGPSRMIPIGVIY